jgi:hypothetical protein
LGKSPNPTDPYRYYLYQPAGLDVKKNLFNMKRKMPFLWDFAEAFYFRRAPGGCRFEHGRNVGASGIWTM